MSHCITENTKRKQCFFKEYCILLTSFEIQFWMLKIRRFDLVNSLCYSMSHDELLTMMAGTVTWSCWFASILSWMDLLTQVGSQRRLCTMMLLSSYK